MNIISATLRKKLFSDLVLRDSDVSAVSLPHATDTSVYPVSKYCVKSLSYRVISRDAISDSDDIDAICSKLQNANLPIPKYAGCAGAEGLRKYLKDEHRKFLSLYNTPIDPMRSVLANFQP